MVYIIVYTIPSSPEQFYIPADNVNELAQKINSLSGKGATIKVYSTTSLNYKLKFKDKIETITTKIPEVEILP